MLLKRYKNLYRYIFKSIYTSIPCLFCIRRLKFDSLLLNGHVYACAFCIRTVHFRILKFIEHNVLEISDTDMENTE